MVNRHVRSELLKKIKTSRQALNQRAKRIKEKYGPMTTEEAVYIIAHKEGIDLSKHLSLQVLDRIRSLLPREIKPSQEPQNTKTKATRKNIKVITYPLISKGFIQQAVEIGEETYPQVVVLENSIRMLIEKTLSKIDKNWWNNLVSPEIQKSVSRIIDKEKKYPYREKRGNQPLMYCNFSDLKKIVMANSEAFQYVIANMQWFEAKMDEVYMARNNLAHSILLSKDDIARMALFYRDWARLLEAANIK